MWDKVLEIDSMKKPSEVEMKTNRRFNLDIHNGGFPFGFSSTSYKVIGSLFNLPWVSNARASNGVEAILYRQKICLVLVSI